MNLWPDKKSPPAERKKCVLIFNPVAGSGDPDADRELMLEILGESYAVDLRETSESTSATDLAEAALQDGAGIILAAGGDGTLGAVAEAVAGRNVKLGIIPRGTANALASAIFGARLSLDPLGIACRSINEGHTLRMDTALCNGHRMLLLAGVGIERGMVERADRELKDKYGALAYIVGGWQQLREQESFAASINTAEGEYRFQTRSLVIANAAPPSSIFAQGNGAPDYDDGLLDVTAIVNTETVAELAKTVLSLITSAFSDSENENEHVVHFRTRHVFITTDPPQKLVVDGEIKGETPAEFSVEPKSLEIFAPESEPED